METSEKGLSLCLAAVKASVLLEPEKTINVKGYIEKLVRLNEILRQKSLFFWIRNWNHWLFFHILKKRYRKNDLLDAIRFCEPR